MTAKSGAGVIADVSYAIPDTVGYTLPYYWQFYIWGEKGMIAFSLNCEALFFENGKKEGLTIEKIETPDYLTDFLNLTEGKDVILPTKDVFSSTRITLEIQKNADLQQCNK